MDPITRSTSAHCQGEPGADKTSQIVPPENPERSERTGIMLLVSSFPFHSMPTSPLASLTSSNLVSNEPRE
jgi:hypothetical protein